MKKVLAITTVAVLAFGLSGPALAGQNGDANLAVDLQAKAARVCPISYTSPSSINWIRAECVGVQDVIVVLYEFNRVTGVSFRLSWNPAAWYGSAWTKCSDLEITTLSAPAGTLDASLTWSTCQVSPNPPPPPGGGAGIGVGWIRGTLYGGPYRIDFAPGAQTLDCNFQLDPVFRTHSGFGCGSQPGPTDFPPTEVGPTATEPMTWSGVKTLYR